jgi:hypothetical protein
VNSGNPERGELGGEESPEVEEKNAALLAKPLAPELFAGALEESPADFLADGIATAADRRSKGRLDRRRAYVPATLEKARRGGYDAGRGPAPTAVEHRRDPLYRSDEMDRNTVGRPNPGNRVRTLDN